MRLLLFILASTLAFADVTATPSSVSKTVRESPSKDGAAPQTITPARVQIALDTTPSEAWTVTKAGTLSTACNGWGGSTGPCFEVEDTSGNAYADGTGATGDATIVIRWRLFYVTGLADGVYTGTVTVDPATGSNVVIDVTLTVVAEEPYVSVTYNGGYPLAGCSNPEAIFYNYLAQCPVSDEYPPNLGFSIPAKGASYVDPRFGATVTRLTTASDSCNHRYSTSSPFSINNTYFMCTGSSGEVNIWSVASQTIVYASVPVYNISSTWWSPIAGEDEVLYFFDGGGIIKKRVLNTSTTSTVKDLTGAPWNFTALTDGGTSKPSRNGYLAFWDAGTTDVCAINLATTDVYCADYGTLGITFIDFVEIEYDSVQEKIYVKFISDGGAPQWSVNIGGGVLDLIGEFDETPQTANNTPDGDGICETGENCLGTPHSTLMADAQGRVVMLWAFDEILGNDSLIATAELSKGAGMLRPVEETGGGLRFLQAFKPSQDGHFGASHNGAAVVSTYSAVTAQTITGATSANPSVITKTSHGWSNGNVIVIGSATGNTCINGVWTVANATANTFELSGSTCSGAGSYNTNTGHMATGVAPADGPNRDIIWLIVPGTNGYIKPLAQNRTKAYNGGSLSGCCNTNPRAAISYDGSRVLFASTMGVPEGASMYMVETGYAVAGSGGGGMSGEAKIVGKGKIF